MRYISVMSASTSQQPLTPVEPSPTTLLFARGLLALLDIWPALTIAVTEQWGGPESADKKTWLASTIIDLFEPSVPAPGAVPSTANPSSSEAPIDFDDLADLINQIMSDEFEANIEDGSIDSVTGDILRLWKDITSTPEPTVLVDALERKAGDVRKKGVQAQKGAGPEELDMDGDDDDWSSEEDMEVDGEAAPQLVPSAEPASRERQEPVIDEDGFTLVQKPRRR